MNVVVSNPGAVPEIPYLAAGLARASALRCYLSPFGGEPPRAIRTARALAPQPLRRRLDLELRRRDVRHAVPASRILGRTSGLEAVFVMGQRAHVPLSLLSRVLRERNRRFDRAVADELSEQDDALAASPGAACVSFRRSRDLGIRTFLASSIAHHRFAVDILAEERELQPRFASTLQYHDFPPAEVVRMDEEIALADHVLVLSSFHKQTFVESGINADRIIVAPPGVDIELFRPALHEPASPFRVIFVGQLTQRKGLSYLLDAFSQLGLPDLELCLVGRPSGPLDVWTRDGQIRHIAHVPRWQLPSLYQSAHVFVLPSLVEGFGLTALEAMACGLPVILSEHTFAHDLITQGRDGIVIPIRDSEAIASAILELRGDEDRRRAMGVSARARVEKLTWRHYGDAVSRAITGQAGGRT